jgi:hypothetical protein
MTLEYHQIMSVALVVSEKEILAVGGINVLPVLKRQLNCGKRRMSVKLITYVMLEMTNKVISFFVI